jgi:hypothetical protein
MDGIIDKRFPFFGFLILLPVMVCVSLLFLTGPPAGAQDTLAGELVTDRLGVASFMPPGGSPAFSPTSEHEPLITFSVSPDNDLDTDRAGRAMRDYEGTFSTRNYTLILKENLYLSGWSGVRVLAQGTEENTLFGRDYIWIQEYFTDRDRISLVFHCDAASFETYRDIVLKSFRSLTITERDRDGL